MNCVLKENDIVNIEEAGRFLVVKSMEFEGEVYHYMIKLKETQENPEIIFVTESIDDEDNLDLEAVTNVELIENLLKLVAIDNEVVEGVSESNE